MRIKNWPLIAVIGIFGVVNSVVARTDDVVQAEAWAVAAVRTANAQHAALEPAKAWRVQENKRGWEAVRETKELRLPLFADVGSPRLIGELPGPVAGVRWLIYYAGSPGTSTPVHLVRAVLFEERTGKVLAKPLLAAVSPGIEPAEGAAQVSWDARTRVLRIRSAADDGEEEVRL